MKKNSPLTIGTSCGRREAHLSISPRESWPRWAAWRRCAGVIAHIRSSRSGSMARLAGRGIAVRVRCLLCRFPHCFGSSVGEHGRGSGAGADGCQAEKLDSRRTARAVHAPGPKAGLPVGAGGALFCLICRQAKPRSRRICSPTEGTKAHRARRRRALDPSLSRSRSGALSWLAVMILGCSWSCPASRCAASRGSSGARARSRTRAPTSSRSSR